MAVLIAVASLLQPLTVHTALNPRPHDLPNERVAAAGDATADLRRELEEQRRVLSDAQSALAERDREISSANDELRMLRADLAAIRTKVITAPATTP